MKIFYPLFIIIFISIFSCSEKKMNPQELCKTLAKLYQDDQKYRGSKEMEDPFFEVFHSVRKKEGITKEMYLRYSNEEQLAYGRKIRAIVDKMKIVNQEVQDSLMDLQIELDNKNTKQFLEIVKNYGFPDTQKLECTEPCVPFSIFLHSREEYWDEIKEVLEKEKAANRIVKGDYNYIMWHVNGRKGHPILNN